jgi:hypothetical protein
MRREVKRHGPGEQPPGRVALRIVHPVSGYAPLHRCGQREAFPGIGGHGDTVAYRKDKPATTPGNSRAYLLPDREGPHLRPGPVITVDRTAGQIDEQQRPGLLIPMRRLTHIGTEIGKNIDTRTREAGHAPPALGRKQPRVPRSGRLQHSKLPSPWQAITAGGRFPAQCRPGRHPNSGDAPATSAHACWPDARGC